MSDKYENPLVNRYASQEMNYIWSSNNKFKKWRLLWIYLAEGQKELGLNITQDQINELYKYKDDINYNIANEKEKECRHDVMSHIYAYGIQCPNAKPIIHLGATSCFITDNTELIQLRESIKLIQKKLLLTIKHLTLFCDKYKHLPTLGFTHFQPAQLVTVGKRASLWLQDFYIDFQQLEFILLNLPLRGIKGTTGTQASFLELFNGDKQKLIKLNKYLLKKLKFEKTLSLSGQTYTRKIDYQILSCLSGIAQTAYKMGNDIRLLSNLKEMEEPFEKNQIGSSAMAYKRNPMRSERICSLARYVMSLVSNASNTASNQWFERTLDDSANRRLTLPQSFIALDVILNLTINIISGLQVWENVIKIHVMEELPFMTTETILMAAVKAGGDRQELHEIIRKHSMEAIKNIKLRGEKNDLLYRIKNDIHFKKVHKLIDELLSPERFIGNCKEQVTLFIQQHINPLLMNYKNLIDDEIRIEINV